MTDKQTNERTGGQHRCIKERSLSRAAAYKSDSKLSATYSSVARVTLNARTLTFVIDITVIYAHGHPLQHAKKQPHNLLLIMH